jgi:CRISPR/Cas system-associated exonuclease Cas4 (RecB family)
VSLAALIKSVEGGEVLLPKLRTFLIQERALIDKGKLRERDIVIADAKLARRALFARIQEYNHREKLKGEYFHPSRLGACMRQVWFDAVNAPRQLVYTGESLMKDHLILEGGTYAHIMFQNLCQRAGLLVKREVAIKNSKLRIIGHSDGELLIETAKYLLEIKTINSRRFTMLGGKPQEGHKRQIMSYMKALGLTLAVVIYLEKDSHKTKEFVINYEEGIYRREVAPRIDYFFRCVRKKIMPLREGPHPKKFPCSFCPFTRVCWDTQFTAKFLKSIGAKEEK